MLMLIGGEGGEILEGATAWWKIHGRNIGEAVIVMALAWLTIEWTLFKLPKKSAVASTIKRVLSVALGITLLIILEEMAGGVEEMAHHEGTWWNVAWDHKRPIVYGAISGGLISFFHPWIKSKMPTLLGGDKKK